MFIVGYTFMNIYQYTLSQPWNTSTATWDGPTTNLSVSAQDTVPLGLFFKPDGTKIYLTGNTNDRVYQYTLSKPWNLSTATWDGSNSIFNINTLKLL